MMIENLELENAGFHSFIQSIQVMQGDVNLFSSLNIDKLIETSCKSYIMLMIRLC